MLIEGKLNNAIGSEGASPIIRVPWAEEWMIKRALDAGAHGIMTPMCHTAVRLSIGNISFKRIISSSSTELTENRKTLREL